ncbi:MAG: hypothetical protein LBH35_09205, partial [Treponema sp.]|nr:hypothetical protein [Treponema sp.]
MKKVVCFIIVFCVIFSLIYGEEIVYEVTRETPLINYWGKNVMRTLIKGEELYYGENEEYQGFQQYAIRITTKTGETGMVNPNDILSVGSQTFPERIISKQWIYSFYQNILSEQDREALFKYETFWRDEYEKALQRELPTSWNTYWWEHFHPTYFGIVNNMVHIGELFWDDLIYFVLTQQYQNENTTVLKAVCSAKKGDYPENPINKLFNEGDEYTLIFKRDGDYMDFYVGDENNKICTLIGVDNQFIETLVGVVRGEQVDLSRITWPRRADGSMDYPPPQPPQAVPDQPEPVTADTPATEHEDTATVTPEQETVAQQPGIGLPLIVALAALGAVAVAGAAVFLIR